jgi:LysM repeat protein
VTHVPATLIADQARKHLGEPGPIDSCVSNGLNRWPAELGLPAIGTASVTKAVALAKAGHNGYRYVEGTQGLARGHFGIWSHEALGSVGDEHTCVVDEVEGALWRGIGSGTPSGKVARQPASGGMNPRTVLVGYIVAPTETHAAAPAPTPKPATPAKPAAAPAAAAGEYVVKRGDTLVRIAAKHRTTWRAIVKANPASADGKSRDFHIVRPNLIVVGQRIRLP